jgi:hypothetical protein
MAHAMIAPTLLHTARGIGLFFLYAFIFWRTFKDNPGNRVIQCGSITLMLLLVILALTQIPHVPFDYVAWLGPALFVLCMLTMFFFFQQGYRELRERPRGCSAPRNPETDMKLKCTFCQKPRVDAAKLIESPDKRTYICDECVLGPSHLRLVSETAQNQSSSRFGISFDRITCSFCNKKVRPSRLYVSAGYEHSGSYICKSCLTACRGFVADEARTTRQSKSWLTLA